MKAKIPTLSASKIDLWDQCELKFFAHVILGFKPKKNFANDPKIQLGSLLHRHFHGFYKSQVQTNLFKLEVKSLDDLIEQFKEDWQELCKKLDFEKEEEKFAHQERGITALKNFYEREKQRGFKQPIYMEQWFTVKNESYGLNGRIDRIDREADGSITVIDYKITDKIQSKEDIAKDIQLSIYALACIESVLKERANKLVLYYPIQGEEIATERNSQDLEALESKIEEISHKVTKNSFEHSKFSTNPAEWKCSSCAFSSQCPEHKERKKLSSEEKNDLQEKIDRHQQLQELLNQLNLESNQVEDEIKDLMSNKDVSSFKNYKLQKSENGKKLYLSFD